MKVVESSGDVATTPEPDVDQRKARRLRDWLTGLGLFAFAILVALIVGEGAVRLVAPQQLILPRPDVWQPSDTFGHIKRPNIRTTMNVGAGTVQFVTDSRGFRIGAGERQSGERRILLLGDSFMEAREVEYEESLAGLLESRLSSQLGETVEVWNAGVSDWEPSHYALQARSILATDSVDLVIIALYLGNDIVKTQTMRFPPRPRLVRHEFRMPQSLTPSEFVDAILYPINDKLEERSHLFLLIKYAIQSVMLGGALSSDYFPSSLRSRLASDGRWDVTADICADIAATAAQRGIPTLVVLVPAVQQTDSAVVNRFLSGFDVDPEAVDIDQPTRIMSGKLGDRGLETLDPLPAFREEGEGLYFRVGYHLNREGHQRLADIVVPPALAQLSRQTELTTGAP